MISLWLEARQQSLQGFPLKLSVAVLQVIGWSCSEVRGAIASELSRRKRQGFSLSKSLKLLYPKRSSSLPANHSPPIDSVASSLSCCARPCIPVRHCRLHQGLGAFRHIDSCYHDLDAMARYRNFQLGTTWVLLTNSKSMNAEILR